MKIHISIYFLITALLICIDAYTKYWAENYLQGEVIILSNILSLFYAQNTGIAFSIPLSGMLLKIITVILIFGIFYYYWKEEKQKKSSLLDISYALIFAGALWNAWERIFQGYVVDFISLERFAVFNMADSYISIWAVWILYYYFRFTS